MQLRKRWMIAVRCLSVGLTLGATAQNARAERDDPSLWLGGLQDAVAGDLRAGKPLVVQVHVALCDSGMINCGGKGLGDGDSLEKNLYWATTEGFRGWFDRRGSGWKRIYRKTNTGDEGAALPEVLEVIVWRKTVKPTEAWRRRGVLAPFEVDVVASAWRGSAINHALDAYVKDLFGSAPVTLRLDDGTTLAAGGAARLVAYTGHNRWMDLPPTDWAAARASAGVNPPVKGTIAVACYTAAYLADGVSSAARVPLLFTADFLCAGGAGVDGAVSAFSQGEPFSGIRMAAARAYAEGEEKPVGRVQSVFINPGDRRWKAPH